MAQEHSSFLRAARLYKLGSWIAAGLLLLGIASLQSLVLRYTREMPQVPQIESGRTVRMSVFYGKTVFVTVSEEHRLYAMVVCVLGAVGTAAVMDQLRRRALRRSKDTLAGQ
jgi:hypothetical protein